MESTYEERCIDVRGLRVHYLEAGPAAGTPVILLHGGGLDSASLSYGPTIAELGREHRVLAPDLPGYGESDKPDLPYTTEYYAGFLGHFMDALSLQRASLVGLSLGGAVALGYALQCPERVDRLVLVNSHGLGREYPYGCLGYLLVRAPLLNELTWAMLGCNRAMVAWSLRSIVHNRAAVTPELVDEVCRLVRRPGAGAAWRSFQRSEVGRQGARTNYLPRLGEVAVPTLILHAEGDSLVPVAWAERAHQRIPRSRLVVVPKAGHWLPRDNPGEFSRQVLGFLR